MALRSLSHRDQDFLHPLAPRVPRQMEQWQYEVTGSGRIWYCIDGQKKTVWLTVKGQWDLPSGGQ